MMICSDRQAQTALCTPNLPICHNLLMCGRCRLSRRKEMIEEYFRSVSGEDDWIPRYNIAPTQPVPVIRQNPKEPRRELSLFRWGLIPSWAKDPSIAAQTINARSETAATKPAFLDPLTSRRCLVPADRFYRWQRGERRNSRTVLKLMTVNCSHSQGCWIDSVSGFIEVFRKMLGATPQMYFRSQHEPEPK